MLGMSMTEIVIILALALLLLGPDQLPTLARSLGKGLRELRKATDDIKNTFESEIAAVERDADRPHRMIAAAPAPEPTVADDPGAARAAARRAAGARTESPAEAESARLRLVAPAGTIPRRADAPAGEAAVPLAGAQSPGSGAGAAQPPDSVPAAAQSPGSGAESAPAAKPELKP